MVMLLTSEDIRRVFDVNDFVGAVEESYRLLGLGAIRMLPRINVDSEHLPGFLKLLPCNISSLNIGGVLVYTAGNDQGIEKIVLLYDEETGALKAVIEGNRLSWLRTGASSAVATKYLAREDAEVIGIIGSGRQARSQLMAIHTVRKLKLVKVYSPNPDHRLQYCKEMAELLGVEVIPVNEAKDAVIGSDILSTATTSKKPILDGDWIEKGTHINAIGAHYPDQAEVDETTIKKSKVIVDSRERALKEEGELLIPISKGVITKEHIYAELGDIVAGKAGGRKSPEEITFFTSGGMASEYLVPAAKILEKALKEGIGQELHFEGFDTVPKALYSKRKKFLPKQSSEG
jgi:ornithine cyclodeaminase/alanine dehydrogenase-like protein (mu-crystallin family)